MEALPFTPASQRLPRQAFGTVNRPQATFGVAWRIQGGDAKGDEKYDGKAEFRNDDKAKYGKKIQVYGTADGDVLVEPYSGGYGYAMFRAQVVAIRKVKYRINRLFTTAQTAHPAVLALPECGEATTRPGPNSR